jgi:hypothetical protein
MLSGQRWSKLANIKTCNTIDYYEWVLRYMSTQGVKKELVASRARNLKVSPSKTAISKAVKIAR